MCLLSGDQVTPCKPALPSVSLHFHWGYLIEYTWTTALFTFAQRIYSLFKDHSIYCNKDKSRYTIYDSKWHQNRIIFCRYKLTCITSTNTNDWRVSRVLASFMSRFVWNATAKYAPFLEKWHKWLFMRKILSSSALAAIAKNFKSAVFLTTRSVLPVVLCVLWKVTISRILVYKIIKRVFDFNGIYIYIYIFKL